MLIKKLVLTIGQEKLGNVNMRKLKILICEYCHNEYESRLKTKCCSRKCSNKFMGIYRKTTIDEKTGFSISKSIAIKSADTMKQTGWYGSSEHVKSLKHTPEVKEKRGKNISASHLSIVPGTNKTKAQLSTEKATATKILKGLYIDPKLKDDFTL